MTRDKFMEATGGRGVTEVDLRRLHWNCRRGLLELDLTLTRFLERHARQLERADLVVLNELLELDDDELWGMVSSRIACKTERHAHILQKLQEN